MANSTISPVVSTTSPATINPQPVASPVTEVNPQISSNSSTGVVPSSLTTASTQPAETPSFTGMISTATPAPVNAPREITSDQTVAGRLDTLLDKNSPYIQSARASGMDYAASRGMINSSMAAGASEKSAIDAAAPIAAQDASTFAASGLSAQNANQQNTGMQYQSALKTIADAQALFNSTSLQEQQGQISSSLQAQKDAATAQLQTALKSMDINVDMAKIDSANRSSFVNAIGPVMQQYQSSFTNIQTQPDSVMSADAKATAIANLSAMYKPQIESLSNIYSYPLTWGAEATTATTPAATTSPTPAPTPTPTTTATSDNNGPLPRNYFM